MSYNLLKTDGSTLAPIVDGTIDQSHTDLTLIGKDSVNYGIFLNEKYGEDYKTKYEKLKHSTNPNSSTNDISFDEHPQIEHSV